MEEKQEAIKYTEDPFYKSYCELGSAQYTDENPPSNRDKIWNDLAEIRAAFKKYPVTRLPNSD